MPQKPKYKIRLVHKPGDENKKQILDKISELDDTFFPGCRKEVLEEQYWWFVYDSKDRVIGYAGLRYLEDEKYGYFSRAGILRAHRGQGLHKRLISTRIKKVKQLAGDGVITYVSTANNASMNSLVSKGFRAYTPERRWAGPDFLYLKLSFNGVV
jgi:GNAT superfamily N-acetyltransferase